jgi:hypothetical protein
MDSVYGMLKSVKQSKRICVNPRAFGARENKSGPEKFYMQDVGKVTKVFILAGLQPSDANSAGWGHTSRVWQSSAIFTQMLEKRM